jgi:hypothetical protein
MADLLTVTLACSVSGSMSGKPDQYDYLRISREFDL